MFRHITRSFREVLERNSRPFREQKQKQECRQLRESQNKFYPICTSRTKHNSCDASDAASKEEKENEKLKQDHIYKCPLLGALGWSGVVVLGWYVTQPICWRKFERVRKNCPYVNRKSSYVSFKDLLTRYVFSQPISYGLPKDYNATTPVILNNDHVDNEENHDLTQNAGVKYGPLTAQEALDEAATDLEKAQNFILGDVENKLGVQCMEKGNHKEAIFHFRKATALENVSAAFNLALCYELGFGTAINLGKAVKWYQVASERGHATAMYNLGVFYAQGRGNLSVDNEAARRLFESASKLGQQDAIRALGVVCSNSNSVDSTGSLSNITYNRSEKNTLSSDSENILLKDVKPAVTEQLNATDMLLEALGIVSSNNKTRSTKHVITDTSATKQNLNMGSLHQTMLPHMTTCIAT